MEALPSVARQALGPVTPWPVCRAHQYQQRPRQRKARQQQRQPRQQVAVRSGGDRAAAGAAVTTAADAATEDATTSSSSSSSSSSDEGEGKPNTAAALAEVRYCSPDGAWVVRPLDKENPVEVRRVVALQTDAFHTAAPLPMFDDLAKSFFKAEVLSGERGAGGVVGQVAM